MSEERPSDLMCLWWLRMLVLWSMERGDRDALRVFHGIGVMKHALRGFKLLDAALARNLRQANQARGTAAESLLRAQCEIAARTLPVVGRDAHDAAMRKWTRGAR